MKSFHPKCVDTVLFVVFFLVVFAVVNAISSPGFLVAENLVQQSQQ